MVRRLFSVGVGVCSFKSSGVSGACKAKLLAGGGGFRL